MTKTGLGSTRGVAIHFARSNGAAVLLLAAYAVHVAEEWFGGFSAWTRSALGNEVSAGRFLLINAIGLLLFVAGTVASLLSPRMEWFSVSFAALVGLNGVLHVLATLAWGRYSPGTVTGVVLYLPLGVAVLRSMSSRLSAPVFAAAVCGGVLFHALVSVAAFV